MFFRTYIQALKHLDILTLLAVICVIWSSTNTFIYCFFGNFAMDSLVKIPHMLYISNWPELSCGNQKFFILMIGNAQRSINFHGYIINSTLESYSKVCNFFIFHLLFFHFIFRQYIFEDSLF